MCLDSYSVKLAGSMAYTQESLHFAIHLHTTFPFLTIDPTYRIDYLKFRYPIEYKRSSCSVQNEQRH
jgi:hypothetical protein